MPLRLGGLDCPAPFGGGICGLALTPNVSDVNLLVPIRPAERVVGKHFHVKAQDNFTCANGHVWKAHQFIMERLA
jgi:hypothetical protein